MVWCLLNPHCSPARPASRSLRVVASSVPSAPARRAELRDQRASLQDFNVSTPSYTHSYTPS
jgi:hypothetical protein